MFEDRLYEFEEESPYTFRELDVSPPHATFYVRAPPDSSLFILVEKFDISLYSIQHKCDEGLYQCRVLDRQEVRNKE